MLTRQLCKQTRLTKMLTRLQSNAVPQKSSGQSPARLVGMQFGKQDLVDFGELPRGKIPAQLQQSPEHQLTRLENNVGVITEVYPGELATVSVFLRAGSRYEDIATSGSARMLAHLFFRGTKDRSREDLEKRLEELGSEPQLTFERELIGLSLRVEKRTWDVRSNFFLK